MLCTRFVGFAADGASAVMGWLEQQPHSAVHCGAMHIAEHVAEPRIMKQSFINTLKLCF